MALTFDTFRTLIPPKILARGRAYFDSQNILDLSFDEEDLSWQALESIPHNQLMAHLLKLAKEDKNLRHQLLISLAPEQAKPAD